MGHRIAEAQTVPAEGVRARLGAAVGVLNELGGLAELEERDGSFVIRGYSCPLAGVASDHPEVCRMAESLITELRACRSTSTAIVVREPAVVSR